MTGYQEIYTDPSYFGQIIVNTTSHIGNYGVHKDESESDFVSIKGLVVNEFSSNHSRAEADSDLQNYLFKRGTVGISGIDTRKLVRHIRTSGAQNAIISSENLDYDELRKKLEEIPHMASLELSSEVNNQRNLLFGRG